MEDGVEFEVTAAGSVEEFDLDAFKEGVAEVAGVDVDRVVKIVTPASVKVSVHINAPDEAEQEALTTKLNEKLADAEAATKALKVKVVGDRQGEDRPSQEEARAFGEGEGPRLGANGPSKPAFENGKAALGADADDEACRPDGAGRRRRSSPKPAEKYNCWPEGSGEEGVVLRE